jgi:DNA-binding NarL/FixJ family response regulator
VAAARPYGNRVFVIEDDGPVRELMATLLRDAGYETEEWETGEEALAAMNGRPPLLALIDVHLPGISGYEVCRKLREQFDESVPILFVSGERVEAFDRVAGLLVGGDDYLVKPFAPDELVARVSRLARRSDRAAAASGLTQREVEVLRLLAEGMSQSEIARALVISPKTVAKHIEHILGKLGVHTRAQAVGRAFREGVL